MEKNKPIKKTLVGVVVSDKMDKTVTVELEDRKRHPKYGKFVKSYSRIKAHDEKNEAGMGDLVKVISCRPVSKEKCWRVIKILEKAKRSDEL